MEISTLSSVDLLSSNLFKMKSTLLFYVNFNNSVFNMNRFHELDWCLYIECYAEKEERSNDVTTYIYQVRFLVHCRFFPGRFPLLSQFDIAKLIPYN